MADRPDGYACYAIFYGTDECILVSTMHSAARVMDRFLAEAI